MAVVLTFAIFLAAVLPTRTDVSADGVHSISWMQVLRGAEAHLIEAFKTEECNIAHVAHGTEQLRRVATFTSDVRNNGWGGTLLDDSGAVRYELTEEDMLVVQEFLDKHLFVILDLMVLVLIEPYDLRRFLEDDAPTSAKLHRVVAELRGPWWGILTSKVSWNWPVPLFGALSFLARQLRLQDYPEDTYRDFLWALGSTQKVPLHEDKYGQHIQIIGAPWIMSEYNRAAAYRRACAFLCRLGSKVGIEEAERHVKTFADTSLLAILEPASEWPVFDLMARLAFKADSLEDDTLPETLELNEDDSSMPDLNTTVFEVGQQRLSANEALENYRMLNVVATLSDSFGLRWWVSHGTLIGALRDGGLSRHADDCEIDLMGGTDVEIFQSAAMRAALARNGYELSYDPRGRCFKVWPAGSPQASSADDQVKDQRYWLPQQRVGSPALDVYIVDPDIANGRHRYISNEEFHCNVKVCTQMWEVDELSSFRKVEFGLFQVSVPVGAETYLDRVYGVDWNSIVRPHRWASENLGTGFDALDVTRMETRTAGPYGPLVEPVWPLRHS